MLAEWQNEYGNDYLILRRGRGRGREDVFGSGVVSSATRSCLSIRLLGERGGSVVECRTPEREVRGSRPTVAVLCPWARHFTPRKYWLITQEAMAPSRHDWKIVDWDVKPQHNQPTNQLFASYTKCTISFTPVLDIFSWQNRILDFFFSQNLHVHPNKNQMVAL